RRTFRQWRDRRSPGGLSGAQRAAMRLLHAGHADCRAGFVEARERSGSRTNSRTPFRQLLPLHGISGNRRCGGKDRAHAPGAQAMTSAPETQGPLSALDRPNSYIGKVVPRPNLDRLMQGRGLYVSDLELPRMAHVVFVRSPHAHAKIV